MRLLKLTDSVYSSSFPEYVEVDEIARIETDIRDHYNEVMVEKEVKTGLFSRPVKKKVLEVKITEDAVGSVVYMKTKGKTFVRESPEQIVEMIKNKQYVEA